MKYSVAVFKYSFDQEWQQDLFEAELGELGFDMFDGEKAYILTDQLDETALQNFVAQREGVVLLHVEQCEERNWNETWETEHPLINLPLDIQIRPHGAFGDGFHETTGMMIDRLISTQDLLATNMNAVLDNGCGTGVLGIMAARCGARNVMMVDIDEQSVANTLENIDINLPLIEKTAFTVIQANTPPDQQFDLILSNIHRNILMAQMPIYAAQLKPQGELWLSGFYESDCFPLITEAEHLGLKFKDKIQRGEWRLLVLYQPLTV